MRTEKELHKMIDIANAIIEDPELGECNGMSYEEGVKETLLWVVGTLKTPPLEIDDLMGQCK